MVDAAERNVSSWNDSITALNRVIDNNLAALSDLLEITIPIHLDGLPEMELERITKRDLDKDLAAYTLSAPDVQEKKLALDNARSALIRSSGIVNRLAHQIALEEYDRAQEFAARDFPRVYQDLLDFYKDHNNSTAVKDAETELRRLQGQFNAGVVPRNSVVSAECALLDALNMHEQERISVYIALLKYEFGLINWV